MAALPLTVEAVYEDGIFRPVAPVPLAEHERVEITVNAARVPREWPTDTAEIYRELAEEDRQLADGMIGDVRQTWPASGG